MLRKHDCTGKITDLLNIRSSGFRRSEKLEKEPGIPDRLNLASPAIPFFGLLLLFLGQWSENSFGIRGFRRLIDFHLPKKQDLFKFSLMLFLYPTLDFE